MENDLARLRIEKDEEVWQFNGEGEKNTSRYEHCLVGCFLTTSVVHFLAMRNNMWHLLGGVLISDLGENRYSCKFYQKLDIDRVINGAPWTFNNHLLLFHQLGENENPLEVSLINGGFRNYIRIKVLIDVRMPLKQRKRIMVSSSKQDKRRGNELEMGCDLSLRANPRKATTITSVWLREDDNEDFLRFWREEEAKRWTTYLNEVDLAETIGSNEQQDSSNYHRISTAASGQTDRTLWSRSKGEIQIWLQFMMKGWQRWATSIKKESKWVIKELYRKLDQLNSMERDEKALDALVGAKLNLNIEIDNEELY
ncbi:hypothetical protein Gohar_018894 [Gossypium harknessii]|uniref:DUF4283 domain-containing protein n=1 Tax=Gossypium harknessii TaxID=34285 RepID=A0A7J9GAH1_9ROSI|nr:hypothetical protein [Gossypium harknessii]